MDAYRTWQRNDDNFIYVDDNYSSCDTMCIKNIMPNPTEFSAVDDRIVFGGKSSEGDPSKYLRGYQGLRKEIHELFYFLRDGLINYFIFQQTVCGNSDV